MIQYSVELDHTQERGRAGGVMEGLLRSPTKRWAQGKEIKRLHNTTAVAVTAFSNMPQTDRATTSRLSAGTIDDAFEK